ncbi:hypothetical protein DEO23_14740 [Brachybacterium endophyticum]|uniref:HTH tetR-type domain-containing protein n=1 Tax=Brachybacterium endophyticum TaxID=2182385 RepID=A0A2U2RH05_9MICO|nr:TetR family transcriptional regulator [Brachybacterium endophyticum]PWH05055.1 hypothetical protein DEO23_14740 [Brachybacterium endophyticum]
MAETGSLRERKKAALRDELSVTTVLLARERGIENVRVEDVVERVGVSRRTFGNYFPSKEAAIADRHVQRAQTAAIDLLERPAIEPVWAAITEALITPYAAAASTAAPSEKEQSDLLAVLSTPGIRAAVDRGAREATEVFAQAITARLDAAAGDPLPRSLATAALSTLLCTLEGWVASGTADPLEPLLRTAFDRLGAGFDRLG